MLVLSTDTAPSIDIEIYDDAGIPVSGLVAATMPTVYYSAGGANAKISISLSDLAAETTPWSAGGMKERGNGIYRLDLPTAAINGAGRRVRIFGYSTGKNIVAPVIDCGPVKTDVYSRVVLAEGTVVSSTTNTIVLQTAIGADNLPNGAMIAIISGTGAGQTRQCFSYVNSTKTVTTDRVWVTNPDATSVYVIYASQVSRYVNNSSLAVASDIRQANGNNVTTTNAGYLDTYTASMATGVISAQQFNAEGRLLILSSYFLSSSTTVPVTSGSWTIYSAYLNRPSWLNVNGLQRLWYDAPNDRWVISGVPGTLGTAYWTTASGAGPDATYTPGGTATGVPDLVGYGLSVLSSYQPKVPSLKFPASLAAGDIASDVINGATLKADAVTKIQSGLATSTSVTAISTTIGTAGAGLTAITGKTNLIPANPAAVGSQMDLVSSPNSTARIAIATTVWGLDLSAVMNLPGSIGSWLVNGINQIWGAAQSIIERTDRIPNDPASTTNISEVGSVASMVNVNDQGIAASVWSADTRTLTEGIQVDISGMPPVSIVVPQAIAAVSQESLVIPVIRGDTLRVSLPLVGSLTSRSKLTLTVKASINDSDVQAVFQILEGVGLVRLNGTGATSPTAGSLIVRDDVTGQIDLELDANVTSQLAVSDFVWDVQVDLANGIRTPLTGTMSVVADVTQAVV